MNQKRSAKNNKSSGLSKASHKTSPMKKVLVKRKTQFNKIVVTKDGFSFKDIDKLNVQERVAAFNKWISSKQGQKHFDYYFSKCKKKTDILKNISDISSESLNDIINI